MNKQQREVYLELAGAVERNICAFCKFYECSGSPCDSYNEECLHPLSDKFTFADSEFGMEPGDDCWGFRPAYPVAVCADIVGTVLANEWEYVSYGEMKNGKLAIIGAKA